MTYLRFLRDNAPFLLAGALLSLLSGFGQTFFIGVFGADIRQEFGLSDGDWGWIYTAGTGGSALVMLFAGGLIDRIRVRTLGTTVIGLLALACLAMWLNRSLLLLPLVIFALRFFGQGMASTVAVVAMARWFIATRGRALAIAALGFSVAEAVLPVTMVWLKQSLDWRTLWLVAACVCLSALPLLMWLLRFERDPIGDSSKEDGAGMDNRHWTRAEALRLPLFWALIPVLMVMPAISTAFWFHQTHFAGSKGWDHLSFVAILPLGTLALIISTQIFGWALDRWGAPRLLPMYLIPFAAGLTLHATATEVWQSALGVIFMGIAGGGQSTLPAACWAVFFGTRHIGAIKSAAVSMLVLASALGPGITGALIDRGIPLTNQLLTCAGIALVLSATLFLPIRDAMRRLPAAT